MYLSSNYSELIHLSDTEKLKILSWIYSRQNAKRAFVFQQTILILSDLKMTSHMLVLHAIITYHVPSWYWYGSRSSCGYILGFHTICASRRSEVKLQQSDWTRQESVTGMLGSLTHMDEILKLHSSSLFDQNSAIVGYWNGVGLMQLLFYLKKQSRMEKHTNILLVSVCMCHKHIMLFPKPTDLSCRICAIHCTTCCT